MSMLRMTEEQLAELQRRRGGKQERAAPRAPAPAPRAPGHGGEKAPIALRDQLIARGLPPPYREFTFHDLRDWRLDLAWPEYKLAIEVDGSVHRTKKRFLSDIEKYNALLEHGWRCIRVTPVMVASGEAIELVMHLWPGLVKTVLIEEEQP